MSTTPESKPSSEGAAQAEPPAGRLPKLIDGYTARIRAIRRCAKEYTRLAAESTEQWQQNFPKRIKALAGDQGGLQDFVAQAYDGRLDDELHDHLASPRSEMLAEALFILSFSAFDAFLGHFLMQLYRDEQSLFHKVEDKEIKIADLLACCTIDDALSKIIERDISALLRDSYKDIFSKLANRHGISTIKAFPSWPKFIEAAQRRNLITHCGGVIDGQYLKACSEAEYPLEKTAIIGQKLKVDSGYLLASLNVLYEVGVKLAVTLWKTAAPRFAEPAESFLSDEIFAILKREDWQLAVVLGEFAINLPKKKSDLAHKISRINYAQALKWSGNFTKAKEVLDAIDWRSSIRDLRLGVEVVREKYDDAVDLMRKIGKEGELILEFGYRHWPVFREFRKTPQFKAAFQDVYGTPFDKISSDQPSGGSEESIELSSANANNNAEVIGENSMPTRKPTQEEQEAEEKALENQGSCE